MAFTSLVFVLFLVALVLAFNATSQVMWRESILTFANLFFILSFIHTPKELAPLSAFLVLGYVSNRLVRGWRHPFLPAVLVALIVFAFALLKRYSYMPEQLELPFPYLQIGLSYILFRVLQLVIDGASAPSENRLSLLEFFNYTCNFLCFVSGPIERAEHYLENRRLHLTRSVDAALAEKAFGRMILGYLKVAVVSASAQYAFSKFSEPVLADGAPDSRFFYMASYALAVTTFTVYLYYNFAGYMDIVIGTGWLLGQDLPENFEKPFSARNLFEFWSRWHMTLSEWFKTYLFNPLVKTFAEHLPQPQLLPLFGVLAFFISFFVMGVWHGSTFVFVVYGLVMGAGVSLNKVWQILMTERLGKKRYKALALSPVYSALSQGLTFTFFAMAVTALWVNWSQLKHIGTTLGVLGVTGCLLLLSLATALFFVLARGLRRALPADLWFGSWHRFFAARQLGLAGQILMIFLVTSFFHKAPEFVYKAF
jgi:D-alanyl-lipoteichoic acid acyltransferase DltB (MBOAT superfamily)